MEKIDKLELDLAAANHKIIDFSKKDTDSQE